MGARTPARPQGKAARQAPGAREEEPITAEPTPQEAPSRGSSATSPVVR